MEEDRIATNLGPDLPRSLETEVKPALRQPKRRFVGRRAAEKTARVNVPTASTKESTTIQGVKNPYTASTG
jgi:2-(3-amino-3-carboxypropyl)histidine synthase